ncbi:MAG: hypothetical protein UY92_C0010G0019 [Candidatus Magasanikbacteria bacterium GW2011_GWA2_56_11]|uniref:Uncharacterized protein n=1 Tax=Candidatus Magasanikbacteria bacterium GW2011_GWA2_56_11 TaxID=1619044 RepID=A0A0G1YFA2_9BACT|nr:MAG: hypothetical protein UY92_C0010G0019 [Candidatus Magasanikbacteria bacterium GW2011_GWA2_56_11]
MTYDLVPDRVFLTDDCSEANRPNCKQRGRPHVHIGCGGHNNWPIGSVAGLVTIVKCLQAADFLTAEQSQDAQAKLKARDGAGLAELAETETEADLRRYEFVLFIGKGEDPLAPAYRERAALVIHSVFFPG